MTMTDRTHRTTTRAGTGNRLTYDDDLFMRSRRVLGIGVVNQTVWRFDRPIHPDRLDRLRTALAGGPLGRAVKRSTVPGARDRWVAAPQARPVHLEQRALPPGEVLAWADERAEVDLDPEQAPAWELSTAATTDGGAVLSLLTSHVVCDGGAHVAALTAAASGTDIGRLPVDHDHVTLRDDLGDALGQLGSAVRGTVAAARAARARAETSTAQTSGQAPAGPRRTGDDAPYRPATVVVDCDAEQWEQAARRHGGTSNTLLVAITVEVLLAAGRVAPDRPVRVALPVSLRGDRDLRSNATSGVSIDVDTTAVDGVGRVPDLATIRSRCRREFSALADGSRSDALAPLRPLVQMLPDRAVGLLARSMTAPLCLCSNLGDLPAEFAAPVGVTATSVLMRSVTQGVTPAMMRRTRGGLNAWWSRHGSTVTFAVLGVDPDHFGSNDELGRRVHEVCRRWDIDVRSW
ncbi:hypothetical protein [Aeromicrobium fastidiosum]|uniref:Diacylglycerol O-acyltransferase n=1 Tax=Aeromicrobium fastidiosum TaxID=52699 RepID=A0A641API6_9ACTN|nr:hypothetical protein [Aeromicrobium fastidiosum]KAA1376549.1 hypothetical protein ESP62_014100 [Aeromicrobium fastidiosum]MBP2391531.1 hypothetical protein [Aeromicrobium fastidiosum]